jgi:large subunit ribosomal protein L30
MAKLQVTLKRSRYGWVPKHQKTLRALGLRKREQTVLHDDTPAVRGMIKQVEYAVEVREVE